MIDWEEIRKESETTKITLMAQNVVTDRGGFYMYESR